MSDIAARPAPCLSRRSLHLFTITRAILRLSWTGPYPDPTHWPGTPDGQFGIGRGSLSSVRSHHRGNDLWLRFLLSCTQACREASDSDLLTSWLAPWPFSPGLSDTSRGVRSVHRWRLQLHVWLECGGVVKGGSCASKCPLAVTGPLSCSSAPLCSVPRLECPARVSDTVQRLCA